MGNFFLSFILILADEFRELMLFIWYSLKKEKLLGI